MFCYDCNQQFSIETDTEMKISKGKYYRYTSNLNSPHFQHNISLASDANRIQKFIYSKGKKRGAFK